MSPTKCLLIVDDEEEIRENLRDFADFKGFDVLEAANGRQALERLRDNTPDLIISDLMMPEMGGIEFLQHLSKEGNEIPVVIMTAFGTMESAIEAMKTGASDFISKPIDLPYMMKVVERVLHISEIEQRVKEQQRQLDEDLHHAGRIQRCLLPAPIEMPRLKLDYRFEPLIAIGGDYLTVHQFNDDALTASLYDVSGHGVSAALTANLVYAQLLQRIAENHPPFETVSLLNRFIHDQIQETSMFITLALVHIDLNKNELTCTNAGHPEIYIWRANTQSLESISSHLPPVGVAPTFLGDDTHTTVNIAPGDRIFLYTDGFIEARNQAGKMLGKIGLQNMITQFSALPSSEFLDNIYDEVKTYHHGDIDDDLTFLIIDIL
ncbi:MAG: SpoIIE family protein phosphatase [Candidatus Hinthialibacter antarcticus]|nr:SpoIIE family protein phosphatase [Candidatus Hinthialibacter antarcticus]